MDEHDEVEGHLLKEAAATAAATGALLAGAASAQARIIDPPPAHQGKAAQAHKDTAKPATKPQAKLRVRQHNDAGRSD